MTSVLSKRTPRITSSRAFHLTQILLQINSLHGFTVYSLDDCASLCYLWKLHLRPTQCSAVCSPSSSANSPLWKESVQVTCSRCNLGARDSVRAEATSVFMYLSTEVVGRLNCTHPLKGLTTAGREKGGLRTCECNLRFVLSLTWSRAAQGSDFGSVFRAQHSETVESHNFAALSPMLI